MFSRRRNITFSIGNEQNCVQLRVNLVDAPPTARQLRRRIRSDLQQKQRFQLREDVKQNKQIWLISHGGGVTFKSIYFHCISLHFSLNSLLYYTTAYSQYCTCCHALIYKEMIDLSKQTEQKSHYLLSSQEERNSWP